MNDGTIAGDDIPAIIANMYAHADEVMAQLGYPDPSLRADYHRHLTMLLAQGYVQTFGTRVEAPDLVPHTGALFPWGAPNHDTIYAFAPVDPGGVYRISGEKGSEDISSFMQRRDGPNNGRLHGTPMGEIDVPDLAADEQGRFSFILSPERPRDHDGAWFALHPETTGVVTRHVTSTAGQRDGTWAIERLDRGPAPVRLEEETILETMRHAASFAAKLSAFLVNHVKGLRDHGLNRLAPTRYPNHGGLMNQLYFQGAYAVADDEALIIESEIPETVHYWSVQLLDPFFAGIDAVPHQSSLNGSQIRVDADGRARLVIAARDPGVANWLDTGGWREGTLIWRWHTASAYPEPTIRKIRFADVLAELPEGTPRVDPQARKAAQNARVVHYQTRRRW